MAYFWQFIAFWRAIIGFLLMGVWILLYLILTIFIKHTPERAFALRRHWLTWIGWPILSIKAEVRGKPSAKPALYVCNHRSFTDPVVLCKFLDAFVIAKAEVADYPIINKGAELTGVLWVKRENKDSRQATREKMIETLKAGQNILVFPEGTVGTLPTTLPFKQGSFIEAFDNGFDVVPCAIEYRNKKDLWVIPNLVKYYFYKFSKPSVEVKLVFGEKLTANSGEELAIKAQEWINKQLHQMQVGWTHIDFQYLNAKDN